MYTDYPVEDYLRVADECSARIRNLLNDRYTELEKMRDAINDRYPFSDLFLQQSAVDYEEQLIRRMLLQLESETLELKAGIKQNKETPESLNNKLSGV